MPTGSARGRRAGPAPDPNALRRDRKDDQGTWTTLPAAGRPGRAPTWPLTSMTERERVHWLSLWKLPQAVEWDRQRLHAMVALFVRRLVLAEDPECPASAVNTVASLAGGLGLTTPGLMSNRWKIGALEAGEVAAPAASVTPILSARDRMRVVADAVEGC